MVTAEQIKQVVDVWQSAEDEQRRSAASTRLMLDGDRWADLVASNMRRVYRMSTTERMRRHIRTSINLQQRITDRLATAYRRQPRREIEDGSGRAQKALLNMYVDTGTLAAMPMVGRYAWLLGRVGVMYGEDGRARLLYPSSTAVVVEDELATPTVVMYAIDGGYAVLTAEGSATLDENFKLKSNTSASLGRIPIAWAHAQLPTPGDWWCCARGDKLVESTIVIARIQALMSWVRSQQNRKILEVTGEAIGEAAPSDGSMPDSEIMLPAMPTDLRVTIHDIAVDPKPFIDEMRWEIESIAEQYGIPSSLIDQDTSSTNAGAWSPDAKESNTRLLNELRDDQVEHLQKFETDLADLMIATHPDGKLRRETVSEKFVAHWPPVISAQNPEARVTSYQAMLTLGLISPAQAMQLEYPTLTIDEAEAQQRANLEARADMVEWMTTRNMPADASKDADTLPQQQGAEGGRPKKDDDERRDDEPNAG